MDENTITLLFRNSFFVLWSPQIKKPPLKGWQYFQLIRIYPRFRVAIP